MPRPRTAPTGVPATDAPTAESGSPAPRDTSTRGHARTVTAAACLVLGLGLLAGAGAGTWLAEESDKHPSTQAGYARARDAWHNVPVDDLFPTTLRGTGPGRADRVWTRIAVAPDSRCADAFDPLLSTVLTPVGCQRLLRATYLDATSTSVTTVGVLVTRADADGMRALRTRFTDERLAERADLMPRPYPVADTPAAEFTTAQRATWHISVLTDAPALVYAVTGFADGREVIDPRPAREATAPRATSMPAQSGLAHDAKGVAAGVERAFRAAVAKTTEDRP
ncbi:hypothetical protein LRS74_06040 [Streptomyces sp. LX-29]|uniref:hypothetical protein n=1 Tax=Streptomyces sp. LX-29 TaxID=2900152 RepID=UPI00240D3AB7|nr:hypothetical protein [Streptomyces sp. LX-29]WFB06652.1 hypothetical protein LRS74_06040 [Streptomyces sp. LX-29]